MAASQPRRRKGKPHDPSKPAHDRRATDLLRNAIVAPIEVDDPMEAGAKLIVMRSLRSDPLANLHARNCIDEAQYRAGRKFQSDFEAAERGPKAIDPSKEAVDGGQMPEPITEEQRRAAKSLAAAHRALGADGAALTHDVLIDSKTPLQISHGRGFSGEMWEKFFRMRFYECLDCLAKLYGLVTK